MGRATRRHLLAPLLAATRETFSKIDSGSDVFKQVKVTADSGFHSKAVMAALEQTGADAYVADRDYRRREPAFRSAHRHKQKSRKDRARQRRKEREEQPAKRRLFTIQDFLYDESQMLCICPAGHRLYQSGKHMLFNGYRVAHFKAPITACRNCSLRSQCLRHPERTVQRQISVIKHREGPSRSRSRRDGPADRMRWKFDSPLGRETYGRRMATVEPVFANIQNKGMRRFTLRGRSKVNAQWQLFAMVHNIEKIARVHAEAPA